MSKFIQTVQEKEVVSHLIQLRHRLVTCIIQIFRLIIVLLMEMIYGLLMKVYSHMKLFVLGKGISDFDWVSLKTYKTPQICMKFLAQHAKVVKQQQKTPLVAIFVNMETRG